MRFNGLQLQERGRPSIYCRRLEFTEKILYSISSNSRNKRKSRPLLRFLEDHEREAIMKAYGVSRGNLTRTAKVLGIGRATLYRKLDKFKLQHLKNG